MLKFIRDPFNNCNLSGKSKKHFHGQIQNCLFLICWHYWLHLSVTLLLCASCHFSRKNELLWFKSSQRFPFAKLLISMQCRLTLPVLKQIVFSNTASSRNSYQKPRHWIWRACIRHLQSLVHRNHRSVYLEIISCFVICIQIVLSTIVT